MGQESATRHSLAPRTVRASSAATTDCGSSCGTCASSEVCQSNRTCSVPSTALFFQDNIQNGSKPWGFTATTCEHPIAAEVACSDANGANVTRVPDPLAAEEVSPFDILQGWATQAALKAAHVPKIRPLVQRQPRMASCGHERRDRFTLRKSFTYRPRW